MRNILYHHNKPDRVFIYDTYIFGIENGDSHWVNKLLICIFVLFRYDLFHKGNLSRNNYILRWKKWFNKTF